MADEPADRDVVAFLRSLGATDEQLTVATVEGRLPSVAVDVLLRADQILTVRDVATRLGRRPEEIVETLHLLGLAPPDVDAPFLSEADVTLLGLAGDLGPDVLRVAATSLGRLADAGVARYVQDRELELTVAGSDALGWAEASADVGRLALLVAGGLGSMFVHHVQEAIRWQRQAQVDVAERELARLAVGFVDLAGFTARSARLASSELITLITEFEVAAHRAAVRHGGRIVKHIGDEVMFVALDPAAAASLVVALVAELPPVTHRRAGLAFGDLLVSHGDYYGPVVNLASRLAGEAIPGEALADGPTAQGAGGADLAFEPAGRRMLRGFDEPVAVWSLRLD